MEIERFLKNVKGRIPKGLYEEFEYSTRAFKRGRITVESYVATINGIRRELEQQISVPPIVRKKTKVGNAYLINTQGREFNLLSEPTESGFVNSYHDITTKVEEFRADTALEQKGRLIAPLFLNKYPDFLMGDKKSVLGVDCARFGDDMTVFVFNNGGHLVDCQAYFKQDLAETTGRIVEAIREHRPDEVVVDATGGLGAGVIDTLKDLEMEELTVITGIEFHSLPRSERYNAANAITEAYLILAERLRKGEMTILFHKKIVEQLAQMKFRYRMDGKIILESKADFKKRNKNSPDYADATALSCYPLGGMEVF